MQVSAFLKPALYFKGNCYLEVTLWVSEPNWVSPVVKKKKKRNRNDNYLNNYFSYLKHLNKNVRECIP